MDLYQFFNLTGYKSMTADDFGDLYNSAELQISGDDNIASSIATDFVKSIHYGESDQNGKIMIIKK